MTKTVFFADVLGFGSLSTPPGASGAADALSDLAHLLSSEGRFVQLLQSPVWTERYGLSDSIFLVAEDPVQACAAACGASSSIWLTSIMRPGNRSSSGAPSRLENRSRSSRSSPNPRRPTWWERPSFERSAWKEVGPRAPVCSWRKRPRRSGRNRLNPRIGCYTGTRPDRPSFYGPCHQTPARPTACKSARFARQPFGWRRSMERTMPTAITILATWTSSPDLWRDSSRSSPKKQRPPSRSRSCRGQYLDSRFSSRLQSPSFLSGSVRSFRRSWARGGPSR